MDKISKELTILEIESIVEYYKKLRADDSTKNKFSVFGIKTQWNLKKNMDILSQAVASYEEFKNEKEKELNEKYFNDEKSDPTQVKQIVNGEETEVPGRQVKKEYMEEFKKEHMQMITELYKLSSEKVTLELFPINLDHEIENIADDTGLTMDDLDFLSIFK